MKDGVPIQLILNANPTFVRGDDVHKGLEALAADIKQFGLQQKILLDPDYQIIDGARRVLAFKMLGMNYIPAVSTKDWLTIRDHMLATRQNEKDIGIMPLPYSWAQLADWYNRVLKPFAKPYERFRANQSRKKATGRAKTATGDRVRSTTLTEITAMTGGLNASRMADILRVASTLARIEQEAPGLLPAARTYTERAELMGEAPTRTIIQLCKMLDEEDVVSTAADRKVADQQVALVAKAASLLAVISNELDFDLNPALTEQEAKNLFKLIHPHVRRLNIVRRNLADRGRMRLSGNLPASPRERVQ